MQYQQQQGINMASMVATYQNDFSTVLTDQTLSWQKECQFAEQALSKNKKLADAAKARPATLRAAIINVAAIAISLNPALKHAYLVPRNGDVCLDISYQGLLHLAVKEGAILWGQSELVYEKDTYKNLGVDEKPLHEYEAFGNRGEVKGVYCTVKLPNGDYLSEEMDLAAIQYVQSTSMGAGQDWSPWTKWWGQMARKSVIKRASNYWPKCHLVHEAVAVINLHEGLAEDHQIKDVPKEKPTKSDTLNTLLEKPETHDDFTELLNNSTTLKELKTVAARIATSGERSNELLQTYYQRKEALSNG